MGMRTVVVTNYSRDVRRSDIKELFSECGYVVDCYKTGREISVVSFE